MHISNAALKYLTVPEEQEEIKFVVIDNKPSLTSLTAKVQAAELRKRKIIFAFFQSDFQGGRIPYWHVTLPYHKCYKSTLSMEGLKSWKVL